MSKDILVSAIADEFPSRAAAEKAVDSVFNGVERVVRGGAPVHIRGFGSFVVKERAARTGANPRTKERIQIAAKTMLGFKSKVQL